MTAAKPEIEIELKYFDGEPVIHEIQSGVEAGRAGSMPRSTTLPTVYNGLGISILSTPKGVMSDAEARAQNVGGEVHLHGILRTERCRALAKKPVPVPAGVTVNLIGPEHFGQGAEGRTQVGAGRACAGQARGRQGRGRSARRDEARPLVLGHVAHHDLQHDQGRDAGLFAVARDQRRRLSRRRPGQGAAAQSRLQPRCQLSDPGRHRDQDAEADRDRRSAASTSSGSARSPPRSAISAVPSPTRARASNMQTNASSARKARRSNG